MNAPENTAELAAELLTTISAGAQVSPLTGRPGGLDMPGGYAIGAELRRMREARGEVVIGRKIGFTNRAMWPDYGVDAPMWGFKYDRSVSGCSHRGLRHRRHSGTADRAGNRLSLAAAPTTDMDDAALWRCIDWVAHGFEIVQSPYPGWRFSGADTVAAGGLHAKLLLGDRINTQGAGLTAEAVGALSVDLSKNGEVVETGSAGNVLDHPLAALRRLVELAAADPSNPAVAADEISSRPGQ